MHAHMYTANIQSIEPYMTVCFILYDLIFLMFEIALESSVQTTYI